MSSSKPQSITLPRNFTFHYSDGELPKTPEPSDMPSALEPPNPPRQTYRIRRRRAPLPAAHPMSYSMMNSDPADVPVPTIETHEPPNASPAAPSPQPRFQALAGHLRPIQTFFRPMSSPATPTTQTLSRDAHTQTRWAPRHDEQDSPSRPSTACSTFSDSSDLSSTDTHTSMGGSCTSPDSDLADPFIDLPTKPLPRSVVPPCETSRPAKRAKVRNVVNWTEEMDGHLWRTYLMYLQDPTVTPFKTLPGTAPPLGVCHRVVREAKKTWRSSRNAATRRASRQTPVPEGVRGESPDTIKPMKSGSTTPTEAAVRKSLAQWPRSDSATRRRLRELCKSKPTLSAHYQRLLTVRSQSPFSSSSPRSYRFSSPFSVPEAPKTFSARDMNVSLTTCTSSTMQLGNPLCQLASDPPSGATANTEWFGEPIGRSSVHQKSQSLQLGLGLNSEPARLAPAGMAFNDLSFSSAMHSTAPTAATKDDPSGAFSSRTPSRPSLAPPFELHMPRSLPRSFKRRAQQLDEEGSSHQASSTLRQDLLTHLFGAPAETSHRRVRSRGFSLGDIADGGHRLTSYFTPPTMQQQEATQENSLAAVLSTDVQMTSDVPEATRPLASPFAEKPPESHFNTFPRNFSGAGHQPSFSMDGRFGENVEDFFSKPPSNM